MQIIFGQPHLGFLTAQADLHRVIDITICGDWAGTTGSGLGSGCTEDCASYVPSPGK